MVQRTTLSGLGRVIARAGVLLVALIGALPAYADFASRCSGCHGIGGARRNAADSPAVITSANATWGMGVGAFAGEFAAIAAEIGATFTPSQSINVNYQSAGNGVTIANLVINGGGVVTTTALVTSPTRGTLSGVGTAGSLGVSYSHTAGNCLADSFVVRGTGAANTSNRTVNVNINTPSLVASNNTYALAYSTGAQTINVNADVNPNPNAAVPQGTMNLVGGPGTGTTNATGATTFTYSASATVYAASVQQQYNVDGPCGVISNTATATINVGLPPAPNATNFSLTVPAASPTNINLFAPIVRVTGVVQSSPAGTFNVSASQPTVGGSGSTSVAGDVITYTPPGGFTGMTTITYTKAGPGGTSNTGTITLDVTAAPIVGDTNAGITPFNTPIMVDVAPLITGSFTTVNNTGATNGTTSVAGTVITFTPTAGYFGPASFTYTAQGPGGTSNTGTVSLTVNPPAPTAGNGVAAAVFQTPTPIDVAPFITGVTSPPPVAAFNPVNGTITLVAGTVVTFRPSNGFTGAASFQYTATGPGGTSGTATVTVNVPTPPPPVATNLTVLVSATTPTTFDLAASITGFVNNVTIASPPLLGTASASGTMITYTPIANNPGTVTLQYVAVGPGGNSAPATVTMTYTTAPVTPNLTILVPFNTVTTIDLAGRTAGQFSSLTFTQPSNGIVLQRGNVITYSPNANYFGPDSFTYTAAGTGGASVPGTVTLTVQPPVAQVSGATVSVAFNTPTQINLASLVTGVATSFTITAAPGNGTVVISGNIATYTPRNGFFGADSFAFAAVNGAGTSAPATVSLVVGSLKPVAGLATLTVQLNTSGTLDLRPFIAGSGVTGVNIAVQPAHGTVTVEGTRVTYTPRANYFGTDSFRYFAFGNLGSSDPGTVEVIIVGRPDPALDRTVRGLVDAHNTTPGRFSRAQTTNVQRRLETLHRGPDSAFPEAPPKAPKPAADSGGPPAGSGAAAPQRSGPTEATAVPAPAGVPPANLVSALVSLAASHSVPVDGATTLRDGTSVWMGGLFQFGELEGNGDRSGLRFSTDGVTAGADRRVNERLALGIAAGYARDETKIGADGSKLKARGSAFSAYGSFLPADKTYVDAVLGFGRVEMDGTRFVEPIEAFASSTRKVDQFFGSVAAGYEWRRDGVLVSPYGRLDFSFDKFKAATESGASQFNLEYGKQDERSTQLAIGIRAEAQHEMEFGRVVPRARVEYRHELQGERSTPIRYVDLLTGPEYTVTTAGVMRNALLLGVGTDFLLGKGLKIGLDYQAERASGAKNVQAWRLFVSQDLDFKGLAPFRFNTDMLEKPISVDVGFTHDDNVSRGRTDEERRQDKVISLGVGQERIYPINTNLRLVATPLITAEKFRRFAGLGRASVGLQGELQYRGSAAFDATTFALRGSAIWDEYESSLRSGGRYFLGVNARRALTDKIDLFGEVGGNVRQGKSEVFQLKDWAAKANVDYSLGRNGVLYASGEFRRGDTFSSGLGSITNLALADVFVADDAFESEGFSAYRLEARSLLGTLGWNRPLGPRDSLDFSWRRVQSTPTNKPSFDTGSLRYNVNQYSIVYLLRF